MERFHVILSTEAGHVHEHELDAVDATMAAFIAATRFVDRDDVVRSAHARIKHDPRGDHGEDAEAFG